MTKTDLIDRIQTKTGKTKKESAELLETVFTAMKNTLESGETLKIAGFGNFSVKQKKDRIGRNPRTGEAITIEARRVLSFKSSSLLRASVNGKSE